jgi:hypothetical protein
MTSQSYLVAARDATDRAARYHGRSQDRSAPQVTLFPASLHGLFRINHVFPLVLMLCNASAAVCYAVSGDFRRSLYWIASAVCIAAITF